MQHDPKDPNARFDGLMLDMALKVQSARAARLVLSAPSSESVKWASVFVLALMGQISIAMLHLDKARPHIAAMAILTTSIVLIMFLIGASEAPFQPPIYVSSDPIARVLQQVPAPGETPASSGGPRKGHLIRPERSLGHSHDEFDAGGFERDRFSLAVSAPQPLAGAYRIRGPTLRCDR